ncbi:hypothetical protein FP742_11305 [Vibrio parahaemolyticus]|uniref:Uncharacterized protein n=1 Tax=Vibrio parahaemolyticus serotype O3:K6 (strain RIMD 2210633) TaxID=223926 RepID=Q87PN1_VIBPA|nr:hypothetical protein A6J30_24890 [Vibrio parahaemolyticus]BAC59733.1 hypothetical protein [Vibrio parahaemolyticus RIMD 2210633]AWG78765.1 hypothetical protein C9I78_08230 [Vibrio parahaemolyticus]AWJ78392.1 hypothetical protein C7Y67_08345 [Vibrio parahaemolyticus]AZV71024.1 hypothetical protein D0853_08735 [Vibrio parahaemolyticus]
MKTKSHLNKCDGSYGFAGFLLVTQNLEPCAG